MRRPALLAVIAGLIVVGVGALAWWRPFLSQGRDYPAEIPQAVPLFTIPVVELPPRQDLCFGPAVMDRHSEQARFRVATYGRPRGMPLELTISGRGYRFATRIDGGYADNELLFVPVDAPPRDVVTTICIRDVGTRTVGIYGVDDRTRSQLSVTRAGAPIPTSIQFAFNEARTVSLAKRLPTALDRMDTFRPGFLGPWLFWPLFFLCAIGIPAGALWALWSAVAGAPDGRERPRDA